MNGEVTVKNAKIERTMLGVEDHGIMSFMLHLDYGGAGQGAGGYALDQYDKERKLRIGWGPGLLLLRTILETVGVESWEKLPGQHIRVRASHSKVHAIGHFLDDKRWLDFEAFFEANR